VMSENIQGFEDLIAWQKSRELTKLIYQMTGTRSFSKDFGLRDQIQRAAVSVMSNLAEGFERGSTAEFHQFVVISKASCAEVRSQLYAAFDVGYLSEDQFKQSQALAEEVSRIIGGLRASLQRKKRAQSKK